MRRVCEAHGTPRLRLAAVLGASLTMHTCTPRWAHLMVMHGDAHLLKLAPKGDKQQGGHGRLLTAQGFGLGALSPTLGSGILCSCSLKARTDALGHLAASPVGTPGPRGSNHRGRPHRGPHKAGDGSRSCGAASHCGQGRACHSRYGWGCQAPCT